MKILFINIFTTKLIRDFYTGVHIKGTKKFGSKVVNIIESKACCPFLWGLITHIGQRVEASLPETFAFCFGCQNMIVVSKYCFHV